MNENESSYLWEDFFKSLECKLVKAEEIDLNSLWEFIRNIVTKVPIKKRVTNLEHLGIASQFGLTFVTGDKEVLEKCRKFYPKIMSYIELRKGLNHEKKDNYEEERNF